MDTRKEIEKIAGIAANTDQLNKDQQILAVKRYRTELHHLVTALKTGPQSAERTLAFRCIQQARHWLGEELSVLGAESPYPNGNNENTTVVDPKADV